MTEKDLECSDHKPFITVKSEDGTEHTYYSILYEDLPEEMLRKAKEEVNETEDNKREGMRKLKEYMKKENLPDIADHYIIAVLRCCKYDIKKAKVKLVKFTKTHRMIMTKMAQFDMDEVGALISEMGFGIFPYRDREGRVITFCHPFLQVFNYDMELIEYGFVAGIFFVLTLPHTSLLGMGLVTESEVPEMRFFYPLMRIFIHMIPYVLQLPHRFGCIKILNEHFLARVLYKIMRPFLPAKIVKRICFLGSGYGELHKDYPPEIMPEEFGGNLGPMNSKVYKKEMLEKLKQEIEKLK